MKKLRKVREVEVVNQSAVAQVDSARLAWGEEVEEEEPDKPVEIAESATELHPPIEVELTESATQLHPPVEIEDVPDGPTHPSRSR